MISNDVIVGRRDRGLCFAAGYLTEHLTTLEPRNPEIGGLYALQKRQLADFKALKL